MAAVESPTASRVATDLLGFMNASVTEFHAVSESAKLLEAAGYARLHERDDWSALERGGKYYFTRNDSTLVAFAVGNKFKPGNGFYVIGAHTDRCGRSVGEPSSPRREALRYRRLSVDL